MKTDELKSRASRIRMRLDITSKKRRIEELEQESQDPSFWQDHQHATNKMKELAALQKEVQEVEQLEKLLQSGLYDEAQKLISKLEAFLYLAGPYDNNPAILSIHAGQGGVEAMDWAAMLERMYIRFAQKRGWSVNQADLISGEEAGVKSATLIIEGPYAYGYLKAEAGTHRLVRQSPFNADKLRQTSFALVEVLPQLPPESIEIKDDDLEWQFFRASSQGGQNVQKVSTAVRLSHKPTGITVTAQSERYQEQNRKIARQLLAAKLWALTQKEAQEKRKELKGEYHPASWGTQIRSYVLHPYKLVKDLRTNIQTSDAEGVLEGELDEFIEEEVKWNK